MMPEFDARLLRNGLGRFATGVTVVTTLTAEGRPHGTTVNAFSAVSLDPPLILVSLRRESRAAELLPGHQFTVSVLRREQQAVAMHFAGVPDTGAEIAWDEAPQGAPPALHGSLATFECEPHEVFDGGDHVIVVGRVRTFTDAEGDPLVFFGGHFPRLGPDVDHDLITDYSGSPGWYGEIPLFAPVSPALSH